jgi:hypothetical protein
MSQVSYASGQDEDQRGIEADDDDPDDRAIVHDGDDPTLRGSRTGRPVRELG